jgi:hypothetical protein
MQVSGSFAIKYIFGRACLQASCFLDKGMVIPEFLALYFLASRREGNETNTQLRSSQLNSIYLSQSLNCPSVRLVYSNC